MLRQAAKIAKGAGRALSLKMRTSAFIGTLHEGKCSGGSAVLAGGSGEKWSVMSSPGFRISPAVAVKSKQPSDEKQAP